MGSGGGDAPAPESVYDEMTGELSAKTQLAPSVFATESQFDPQYAGLSLNTLQNFLLGTPGTSGSRVINTPTAGFIDSQTGAFTAGPNAPGPLTGQGGIAGISGGASDPSYPGQIFVQGARGNGYYAPAPVTYTPFTENVPTTVTDNTPASPGYLALAGQASQIADQQQTASDRQLNAGQINNLMSQGGTFTQAMQNADPADAALMNNLTSDVNSDLASGYNLTPAQMRLVQQSVRASQSARGQGYGPADTYGEALGVSQFGDQLYQQRVQNAGQVGGQRYGMYTAPATNLLTTPTQNYAMPYLQQGAGISAGIGPKLFGPDINAQDVYNTNFNAQSAQAISAKNNNAALTGAGISAAGSIAGLAALSLV